MRLILQLYFGLQSLIKAFAAKMKKRAEEELL